MNCPFCEPEHVLFQNRASRVIANVFPAQLGHVLVVPMRHVEKIIEMSSGEWMELFLSAKKAADILGRCMTEDMNLILNQGEIAGQTIKHLHINIIPRQADDNMVNFSRKEKNKIEVSMLAIGFLESIFQQE